VSRQSKLAVRQVAFIENGVLEVNKERFLTSFEGLEAVMYAFPSGKDIDPAFSEALDNAYNAMVEAHIIGKGVIARSFELEEK
jgi:DNA-binding sugar fermentation-stimulating protein